ncbi:hypothetical protein BDW74DRAFT_173092 [Aspergillus multicolor]|uniref:uncharacterized protein n=1 Tax=Aspergillus multicolor TaxID=41759 RepID=UPI003CCDAF16
MASQLTHSPDTPLERGIDYSTKAPKILTIAGVLTGLSLVVVLLRCYVRIFMLHRFYAEDSIMIVCGLCCIGFMVCLVGESKIGMGQFTAAIEAQGYRGDLAQWMWWRSLIVVLGISLVKVSVGLFLLRFAAQRKWLRWFIVGSVVLLVCFTIASLGTLIFQCVPVRAAWDFELRARKSTRCFSLTVFLGIAKFNSSINIITDILYATLPVFMFYNVQVNRRTKVSLMGVLGLGYFACTAGIVKTVFQTRYFDEKEVYREYTYHIWNYVELATGIIAASFPTIKPLVKSIIGSTRGRNSRTHNYETRFGNSYGYGRSRMNTGQRQVYALSSLGRSKHGDGDVELEEDKYRVQIHAAHPSLSIAGSDNGSSGVGSEENLAGAVSVSGKRREGHGERKSARDSALRNHAGGILQTTEVIVRTEESADASSMVGPRRTVEDRI